jgi:hypothetical protein
MSSSDAPDDTAGPLAEFSALRAEILSLSQDLQNIFIFHTASAGVVFSFAISEPRRQVVALVIPALTYMLCIRYHYALLSIVHIGQYIRTKLAPRVPGGLGWEEWLETNIRSSGRKIKQHSAARTAFLGVSAGAWLLATPTVITIDIDKAAHAVLLTAWAASLALVVLTAVFVARFNRRRNA